MAPFRAGYIMGSACATSGPEDILSTFTVPSTHEIKNTPLFFPTVGYKINENYRAQKCLAFGIINKILIVSLFAVLLECFILFSFFKETDLLELQSGSHLKAQHKRMAPEPIYCRM